MKIYGMLYSDFKKQKNPKKSDCKDISENNYGHDKPRIISRR
jgi:hypothetical protein